MDDAVRLECVSKQYMLGLTRTSLPTVVAQQVNRLLRRDGGQSAQRQLWALRDVSFRLKRGESLALIGRNGSGKTTTLKLLAGIVKPTSGRIETHGQLSAVIELGAGFHPDLTGRENIYLNGTILGVRRHEIDHRFEEIVSFSELERFLDTPIKRYSSGMKVRLGFAVAACIQPDVLLLDEVLAVGDAPFRRKCIDRVRALLVQGTSVIFVSHNLWLAQAICKSALYLEKGRLQFHGQIGEAIDRYDRDLSERSTQTFQLTEMERAEQGEEIEITKVEVNWIQKPFSKERFQHDQPAEVQVNYIAYRSLGPITVVVRLIRSDGLTCCMVRSSLDSVDLQIQRGRGVITLTFEPLQLRGGAYFAQVIIRDGADAGSLTTKNSDWIHVGGSVLSHSEMNGVFEPNREWSHARLPDNGDEASSEGSEPIEVECEEGA